MGYKVVADKFQMDDMRTKYGPRQGLEGPFNFSFFSRAINPTTATKAVSKADHPTKKNCSMSTFPRPQAFIDTAVWIVSGFSAG